MKSMFRLNFPHVMIPLWMIPLHCRQLCVFQSVEDYRQIKKSANHGITPLTKLPQATYISNIRLSLTTISGKRFLLAV